MTSETPSGCFVYITLPGETEPVTAGRFALAADRRGAPEGRFVYGRRYLERPNAVALDPVQLKLAARTYSTVSLGGVFGALRDASPDYWGRLVIQRHWPIRSPVRWPTCSTRPTTVRARWALA